MIVKVNIDKSRRVSCSRTRIGTVGENNATTLLFNYPTEIEGGDYSFVTEIDGGSYILPILDNKLSLPSDILIKEEFVAQIIATKDGNIIWKTSPFKFTLFPALDSSGNHGDSEKDKLRAELAQKLHDLTGKDYTDYTWDQLMAEVADISEITPEIQDLIDQATNYENLLNSMITALWGFYGNYYTEEVMTNGA